MKEKAKHVMEVIPDEDLSDVAGGRLFGNDLIRESGGFLAWLFGRKRTPVEEAVQLATGAGTGVGIDDLVQRGPSVAVIGDLVQRGPSGAVIDDLVHRGVGSVNGGNRGGGGAVSL